VGLFQKRLQLVCSRTRLRVNWYFLRVTVRHRRCSASGQSSESVPGHQPFHQAFGIRKNPSCAPEVRVRLRLSQMQRSGPPPCAFSLSRNGFQSFPALPTLVSNIGAVRFHDYFLGLLLDSHAASDRSCSGLLPNIRRSNGTRFQFPRQTQLQPDLFMDIIPLSYRT